MTENKRFVHYEHKGADYILENPNTHLDFIEMLGDCLDEEEIVERLNELYDENEQLKQRNNRQYEQLDRLYNLIEQKDWRALNDILDDFKRCEEQLQREWGTYGDMND